jgi:hypothetical protein
MMRLKTNSIVELLKSSGAEGLEALRRTYPSHAAYLEVGQQLCEREEESETGFLLELGENGLRVAQREVESLLRLLPKRLGRAKCLKLIAGVVTSLTSVGVISAVILNAQTAALLSGVLNLAGSISVVVAQHLESPLLGSTPGLHGLIEQGLKLEFDVKSLQVKLSGVRQVADIERIKTFVQEVNQVCAGVRSIQIFSGVQAGA